MNTGLFRQQVPRPADAQPGNLPPWDAPGADDLALSMNDVRARFLGQPDLVETSDRVVSAVVAPIFERNEEAHVVLIRRSEALTNDPGHLALAGGRIENGESPRESALREAQEEIGLNASEVDSLFALPIARRFRDSQVVAPFVALLRAHPHLVANASEVDQIFEIPLRSLLAQGVAWEEKWGSAQGTRTLHFFADPELLGDNLIWGLTAKILWDLLVRVTETR